MAVLTEDELIKIRRHLHEIPELALQEKETHAYLLEVIQNFKQDYLTIKTPESLPTETIFLACSTRSISRSTSLSHKASFKPKVIGSAWIPWVRPMHGVCLNSTARRRSTATVLAAPGPS